eukprot:Nk52_evm111s221 gene=Nk52_evmTU111s221
MISAFLVSLAICAVGLYYWVWLGKGKALVQTGVRHPRGGFNRKGKVRRAMPPSLHDRGTPAQQHGAARGRPNGAVGIHNGHKETPGYLGSSNRGFTDSVMGRMFSPRVSDSSPFSNKQLSISGDKGKSPVLQSLTSKFSAPQLETPTKPLPAPRGQLPLSTADLHRLQRVEKNPTSLSETFVESPVTVKVAAPVSGRKRAFQETSSDFADESFYGSGRKRLIVDRNEENSPFQGGGRLSYFSKKRKYTELSRAGNVDQDKGNGMAMSEVRSSENKRGECDVDSEGEVGYESKVKRQKSSARGSQDQEIQTSFDQEVPMDVTGLEGNAYTGNPEEKYESDSDGTDMEIPNPIVQTSPSSEKKVILEEDRPASVFYTPTPKGKSKLQNVSSAGNTPRVHMEAEASSPSVRAVTKSKPSSEVRKGRVPLSNSKSQKRGIRSNIGPAIEKAKGRKDLDEIEIEAHNRVCNILKHAEEPGSTAEKQSATPSKHVAFNDSVDVRLISEQRNSDAPSLPGASISGAPVTNAGTEGVGKDSSEAASIAKHNPGSVTGSAATFSFGGSTANSSSVQTSTASDKTVPAAFSFGATTASTTSGASSTAVTTTSVGPKETSSASNFSFGSSAATDTAASTKIGATATTESGITPSISKPVPAFGGVQNNAATEVKASASGPTSFNFGGVNSTTSSTPASTKADSGTFSFGGGTELKSNTTASSGFASSKPSDANGASSSFSFGAATPANSEAPANTQAPQQGGFAGFGGGTSASGATSGANSTSGTFNFGGATPANSAAPASTQAPQQGGLAGFGGGASASATPSGANATSGAFSFGVATPVKSAAPASSQVPQQGGFAGFGSSAATPSGPNATSNTFNFGGATPANSATPTAPTSSQAPFSFGGSSGSNNQAQTPGSFNFGGTAKNNTPTSQFNFGAGGSASTPQAGGGFQGFGASGAQPSAPSQGPPQGGFAFGAPEAAASPSQFSFGAGGSTAFGGFGASGESGGFSVGQVASGTTSQRRTRTAARRRKK